MLVGAGGPRLNVKIGRRCPWHGGELFSPCGAETCWAKRVACLLFWFLGSAATTDTVFVLARLPGRG